MCDYSLRFVASRPANVGDKLVSTRFPQTITHGFASVNDRNVAVVCFPAPRLSSRRRCDARVALSSVGG